MSAAGLPGLVRRVLLPFAFAYVLSYLYRSVNAVIAPDLVAQFDLSPAQLGLLTSAYFLHLRGVPASARLAARPLWPAPHRRRLAAGSGRRRPALRHGRQRVYPDVGAGPHRARRVRVPDVRDQGQRSVVSGGTPAGDERLDVFRRRHRHGRRHCSGRARSEGDRLARHVRVPRGSHRRRFRPDCAGRPRARCACRAWSRSCSAARPRGGVSHARVLGHCARLDHGAGDQHGDPGFVGRSLAARRRRAVAGCGGGASAGDGAGDNGRVPVVGQPCCTARAPRHLRPHRARCRHGRIPWACRCC